jgi:CRISPR type IV-associated protein Csf3
MKTPYYTRKPKSAYLPLRITAYLQCGVISDAALPIDGVLYAVLRRKVFGERALTEPGATIAQNNIGVTMPLGRVNEHCREWYYAASWAQWNGTVAYGSTHWNKYLDVELSDLIDFGSRKARLEMASGRYKCYHMPVYYRHALSVSWYVRGLKDEIEELLPFITHLGKKTSQGFGAVHRWTIEPVEHDWSIYDGNGRLMRAIPAEKGVLIGYRPSYWLPANQTICAVPEGALIS